MDKNTKAEERLKAKCLAIFGKYWSRTPDNFRAGVEREGVSAGEVLAMYRKGWIRKIALGHLEKRI